MSGERVRKRRSAGNHTIETRRSKQRAAEELRVLDNLEHLRVHAPKRFDKMMRLLAKLVSEQRAERRTA